MSVRMIKCIFHEEDTASLAIYHDGFKCYGCGRYGPLSDLEGVDVPKVEPKQIEDLKKTFEYINSLPVQKIRGLELPADDQCYYLCWPNEKYYKARYFEPIRGKYRNPTGHKQPTLWVRQLGYPVLLVVEGEMNALSIAEIPKLRVDICSPGSAGNFQSKVLPRELTSYYRYSTIVIVADRDGPGADACINLMSALSGRVPSVRAHLMQKDANEILVGGGVEKLKKEIIRAIGKGVEVGP